MMKFSGVIGVQQGAQVLFSDYAHDGPMWTGTGTREVRHVLTFAEPFLQPPAVTVGLAMWDMDHKTNARADLSAENVTAAGFDLVFRTWSDSRIARVRATWMAIGPARDEDETWTIL
jgi:hypothetical protein